MSEDFINLKKRTKTRGRHPSSLDWIFANGRKVLREKNPEMINALSGCLGLLSPAPCNGIVYRVHRKAIIHAARPFLKLKNKNGWLVWCGEQRLK
jgi:hypothetical protein